MHKYAYIMDGGAQILDWAKRNNYRFFATILNSEPMAVPNSGPTVIIISQSHSLTYTYTYTHARLNRYPRARCGGNI